MWWISFATLIYVANGASASIKANGFVNSLGGASKDDVAWIDLMTVPEIAGVIPELSLLKDIYDATEFSFKLEQSRQITALMPTNDALTKSHIPQLLPCLPYDIAVQLLQNLILDQVFQASEVDDGDYPVSTASGETLVLRVKRYPNTEPVSAILPPSAGMLPMSAKHAVTPSVEVLLNDRIQGKADNPFMDSANGVAYVIDSFPIPIRFQSELKKALAACGTIPEKYNNLRPADVPRHIDLTNRHHWFWGRVGGTPKFFTEGDDDPLGLSITKDTAKDDPDRRASTVVKPNSVVVGVIQRKTQPLATGVL